MNKDDLKYQSQAFTEELDRVERYLDEQQSRIDRLRDLCRKSRLFQRDVHIYLLDNESGDDDG